MRPATVDVGARVSEPSFMARHEIISREEILSIFERATELHARLMEEDYFSLNDAQLAEHNGAIAFALEGMRFCAAAAEQLRDPSLGHLVIEAIRVTRSFNVHLDNHHRALEQALFALLRAGLRADEGVRELSQSADERLRETIAAGLLPSGEAEQAVLEMLASDAEARVRRAAKKSLASVGEVPWWSGKWASDPAARLLEGELASGGAALRQVSELLDRSPSVLFPSDSYFEALLAALASLPDALAVEAIEHFCRKLKRYQVSGVKALLLALFELPGGLDAFERLLAVWRQRQADRVEEGELSSIVSAAPAPTRLAICRRMLALVAAAPAAERGEIMSVAVLAGAIAGKAWPPDVEVTEVLDLCLARDPGEAQDKLRDYARLGLSGALSLAGADPQPLLERLVEARLAGYPGAWSAIGHHVDSLLGRAPKAPLRAAAERALRSEDPATLRWAAEQLLGELFDPAVDGPAVARAGELFAEPRRAALMQSISLVEYGIAGLRAELRRDALSYRDAVKVLQAIGRIYGGLADSARARIGRQPHEDGLERSRQEQLKAQERLAAFLGPAELRGPPDEADRAALRRARASFVASDAYEDALLWAPTLSVEPWSPEELADLDAFFEAFRGGNADLAYLLTDALGDKPDAALLGRYEELLALCPDDERSYIERSRERAREYLGIEAPIVTTAAADAPARAARRDDDLPGGEWSDEDEP